MTDQVKQQRKVFHLLGALGKSINVLVLMYDMNDDCRKAVMQKLDNIRGSLIETGRQEIDHSLYP